MRIRYESLDLWRGFAALWVLILHSFSSWVAAAPDWLPLGLGRFCQMGWLGVHLFFVISGYCIAERAYREFTRGGTVGNFLFDRFWRIFPPYWAALAVNLVIDATATGFNHAPLWSDGTNPGVLPGNLAEAIKAALLLEPYFYQRSYLFVGWTLTYELCFYLLAALCLTVALRCGRAWAGFAVGGVFAALFSVPAISDLLAPVRLWPEFALGGFTWLALRLPPSRGAPLALLGGTVAWLMAAMPGANEPFALRFSATVAFILVLLGPLDHWLARAPSLRWLAVAGTFSYSIYLIHAPIVIKFVTLLSHWFHPAGLLPVLVPLTGSALALVAARWFYKLVESRSENLRKQHAARLRAAGTAPASL